ncbi:BRO family protein [Methylobacter sp.]|uniref:BRO-N domain-containing protein n=1 Tax=Methylobacter sp. TaxID=2051955 RepID=UPI002488FCEA|nr:BRO family protein [Methylobacter sp.]MDI1278962.1 BRO family protein [Methylobacter sp.]MDI1359752.1 BRO family protein [Methylobacter sp.]
MVKYDARKHAGKLVYGDKSHHHKRRKRGYFINEAGLYHLTFRSNKPKAKDFANWVCETVLPEIRKTGFFGTISIKVRINISKQIDSISLQIVNNKNAFRRKLLQDPLRRLCNIVNQPIPPDDWIAKDCNCSMTRQPS